MKILGIETKESDILQTTDTTTSFCIGLSHVFSDFEKRKLLRIFKRKDIKETSKKRFSFREDKFVILETNIKTGDAKHTIMFGKEFRSEEIALQWIHSILYTANVSSSGMEIDVFDKEKVLVRMKEEQEEQEFIKKAKEKANKKIESFKQDLIEEFPELESEIQLKYKRL